MANEKQVKGVIIPRHDIAENWAKAVNFVPKAGELIVYNADNTESIISYTGSGKNINGVASPFEVTSSNKVRFKFGDGINNVNVLPFVTTGSDGELNPEDLAGYATEDWVKTYVDNNAGAILYLDHLSELGHRIELPDVYPIQSDAEFSIISRNRFEPIEITNGTDDEGVSQFTTSIDTDGSLKLTGSFNLNHPTTLNVGVATLPAPGIYSLKFFDNPSIDVGSGDFDYLLYLDGYTTDSNGVETVVFTDMINPLDTVLSIDSKTLGINKIKFNIVVTPRNSSNPGSKSATKSIKIQLEYGKIADTEIVFTPYKTEFNSVPVNIYNKNLLAADAIDENDISFGDTIEFVGLLANGTTEIITTKAMDAYGTHTIYGILKESYKTFKFNVYSDDNLYRSFEFTAPLIKNDKFTLAFSCINRAGFNLNKHTGALLMLGHIVEPTYEVYYNETIHSNTNGTCDIGKINYPYTLVTLTEDAYAAGYNLFIKWDAALTRNWVENQLDIIDEKLNLINENGPEGTDIPIAESIGTNSISVNDLENNKAYSSYATAAGYKTSAGSNAFRISVISLNEKRFDVVGTADGLEIGMECSCQFSNNYDLFGVINRIETFDTSNFISIYFDSIPAIVSGSDDETALGNGKAYLWVPSNPELGDGETIIGTSAFVTGYGNRASQACAFVAGYNNIAAGKYSIVSGDSNTAGYASAVFGKFNKGHQWSLIGGYQNTLTAPFAFSAGGNNTVNAQYGTALGHSNTIEGEASFVTGTGSIVKSINSLASGVNNTIEATAKESFAVGSNNIIKAPHSAAIGFKHTINASANGRAFAAGSGNTVSHNFSAAIGHALTTSRDSQLVVGRQNADDTSAMFIVGNGTAADKLNNAFVVKETGDAVVSGSLKAKTATISGDLYANAYTGTSGKVVINSATNTATGDSSFSGGSASQALSRFSFAFGNGSIAGTTNDNGKYAVAIGFGAKATHDGAVAIGWGAQALHNWSTVFGINTKTSKEKQLVCGTWNTLDTDSIFIVGNGTSDTDRNYALNVHNNGQALLGSADILDDDKAVTTKKYVDTRIIVGDGVPSSDLDCLLYIRRN